MSSGDGRSLVLEVQNSEEEVRLKWVGGFLKGPNLHHSLEREAGELRVKLWDSLGDKVTKTETTQVARWAMRRKGSREKAFLQNITKSSPKRHCSPVPTGSDS